MGKEEQKDSKIRCGWETGSELEREYHDKEWGVPLHDERKLFEAIILENMQAGLSWATILKKREALREAFDDFNYEKIVDYGEEKVEKLLQNPGIIRNRLKVKAASSNAKVFMEIQKEFGSFDTYIWSFVDFKPIVNHWEKLEEIPASTELSDQISKDMRKRGFKFIGTTTVYAFMQSIGMVNDHLEHCFRKYN